MLFNEKIFTQKTYTINKILSTIKQIQIVDLEEFVIAILDVNNKMFMVHMAI